MTNAEKTELKNVQLKRDKLRAIAKTTEAIFLALELSFWLLVNPPNLVMVVVTVIGYLTINGVLWINAVPLIEKAKELFSKLF